MSAPERISGSGSTAVGAVTNASGGGTTGHVKGAAAANAGLAVIAAGAAAIAVGATVGVVTAAAIGAPLIVAAAAAVLLANAEAAEAATFKPVEAGVRIAADTVNGVAAMATVVKTTIPIDPYFTMPFVAPHALEASPAMAIHLPLSSIVKMFILRPKT